VENSSIVQTTAPLIEAHHITQKFGDTTVLKEISLTLHPKEIVTLIGPNGAGKSTLLKILLGLIEPTAGQVIRKPGLRIGFMPQKIQIDATLPMSVERFLKLGLRPPSVKTEAEPIAPAPFFKGLKNRLSTVFKTVFLSIGYDTTAVYKIAEELNIQALLQQPIQKVSGGEMQRILLARALIGRPELLVLDEPVQGVDLQGQTELYQYINRIRHAHGYGILMVSHDLHIVMKNTDYVLCLNQHMCCSGLPQNVSESPEFQALFGAHTDGIAFYEHHHDKTCEHTHGQPHIELQQDNQKSPGLVDSSNRGNSSNLGKEE
jgi:zinc transport system ATP-binding protein